MTRFMPNRPIWGLGADDFHSMIQFGYGWNVFLIDQLNRKNVRAALKNGCFYFVRAELQVTDEWGIQAWAYTNPFGFKPVVNP